MAWLSPHIWFISEQETRNMNARLALSVIAVVAVAFAAANASAQTTTYIGHSAYSYGGHGAGCGCDSCGSDLWAGYCSTGCNDPCKSRCRLFGGLFKKHSCNSCCEPACDSCNTCGSYDPCGCDQGCKLFGGCRKLFNGCRPRLFHRHNCCDTCTSCGMPETSCGCGMSHSMPHEMMYESGEPAPMIDSDQAVPMNSEPSGEAIPMPLEDGATAIRGPIGRPISFPKPAFRLPSIGR